MVKITNSGKVCSCCNCCVHKVACEDLNMNHRNDWNNVESQLCQGLDCLQLQKTFCVLSLLLYDI